MRPHTQFSAFLVLCDPHRFNFYLQKPNKSYNTILSGQYVSSEKKELERGKLRLKRKKDKQILLLDIQAKASNNRSYIQNVKFKLQGFLNHITMHPYPLSFDVFHYFQNITPCKISKCYLTSSSEKLVETHSFRRVSALWCLKTLWKLWVSAKFPHQKIRCNIGILCGVMHRNGNIETSRSIDTR